MDARERLYEIDSKIVTLRDAIAVLSFDEETAMPVRACEERGEQVAMLSGILHDMSTSGELRDVVAALEQDGALDEVTSALVAHHGRFLRTEGVLDRPFVEAEARLLARSRSAWAGAGAHGSGPAKRTTGPRSPPSWTRWSGWRGRRPPPSAPRSMRTIPCWTSMRKAWMHPRSHPCSIPSRSASTVSWTDAMPTSRPRSSTPHSTRDGFMSCAFPSSGVWAMTNRGGWCPSPLIRSPACSGVTT